MRIVGQGFCGEDIEAEMNLYSDLVVKAFDIEGLKVLDTGVLQTGSMGDFPIDSSRERQMRRISLEDEIYDWFLEEGNIENDVLVPKEVMEEARDLTSRMKRWAGGIHKTIHSRMINGKENGGGNAVSQPRRKEAMFIHQELLRLTSKRKRFLRKIYRGRDLEDALSESSKKYLPNIQSAFESIAEISGVIRISKKCRNEKETPLSYNSGNDISIFAKAVALTLNGERAYLITTDSDHLRISREFYCDFMVKRGGRCTVKSGRAEYSRANKFPMPKGDVDVVYINQNRGTLEIMRAGMEDAKPLDLVYS